MKKTYLYMVVCAAALMMVGCAQNTTDANGNHPEAKSISIGAKIANPEQGRTTLDEDWGDGIRQVFWEQDDKVAIIDDTGAIKALALNPEEEMWGPDYWGYTMFYGEAVVNFSAKRYPVIYPAEAVVSGDRNSISITLPEIQTNAQGGGTLMYATNAQEDAASTTTDYLEFLNLVGYIELKVVGECSISNVTVESASKKLSGAATLVPTYEVTEYPVLTVTGSNSVSLALEEPVELDPSEPTSLLIALPAGTYPAGDLTLKFTTSEGAMEVVSSQEHVLEVSHIKPLEMSVASNVEYVDLTAGETYANAFIVNKGEGYYKFDAKTRGGYTAVPHPNTGETMLTIGGEDAHAGCAWETTDGMITEVYYNAGDNTISFYYDGQKGSAMVTMVGADGLAQWHWLIWATDQPAEQVIGQNTYMDRNLGAWDTPKNLDETKDFLNKDYSDAGGKMASVTGLLWQWGRPIPYPSIGRSNFRTKQAGGWYAGRDVYQREPSNAATCADLWVETAGTLATGTTAEDVTMGYTPKFYFPGGELFSKLYIDRSAQAVSYTKNNQTVFVPWTNKWNGSNSTSSIPAAVAIQKPFHIYGTAASNDDYNKKYWCNDLFENSFDFGATSAPWNYGQGAQTGKTFDVCPYGYHIPDGEQAVADFSTLEFKWRYRKNNSSTVYEGLAHDQTTLTVAAHATTTAGDFVWIPNPGGRVFYGAVADYDCINLWCSSNNNQKAVVTWINQGKDNNLVTPLVIDGFYNMADTTDAPKNHVAETAISTAFGVRCVKDK